MYFTDSLYDVLPDGKDAGLFGELFSGADAGQDYGATGEAALPIQTAVAAPRDAHGARVCLLPPLGARGLSEADRLCDSARQGMRGQARRRCRVRLPGTPSMTTGARHRPRVGSLLCALAAA